MAGSQDLSKLDRLAASVESLADTIARTERSVQDGARLLERVRNPGGFPTRGADELFSLADAGRLTGRHPELLRRWCVAGRLPAVRVGRTWALRRETVLDLARQRSRSRPRLSPGA